MIPQVFIASGRDEEWGHACPRRCRCCHWVAPCISCIIAPETQNNHMYTRQRVQSHPIATSTTHHGSSADAIAHIIASTAHHHCPPHHTTPHHTTVIPSHQQPSPLIPSCGMCHCVPKGFERHLHDIRRHQPVVGICYRRIAFRVSSAVTHRADDQPSCNDAACDAQSRTLKPHS